MLELGSVVKSDQKKAGYQGEGKYELPLQEFVEIHVEV